MENFSNWIWISQKGLCRKHKDGARRWKDCEHRYYQCHIQLILTQESCTACTRISIRCHNCHTKLNNMKYQLLKSILAALNQDHNSTLYDLVVQISNDVYHVIWISIFGFKILSLFAPQANTRIPPQQLLPVAIGKLKKIRLTWYTAKQRTCDMWYNRYHKQSSQIKHCIFHFPIADGKESVTGSPFGTFSMIYFLHHIDCMLYFGFFWNYCETNLKVIIRGYFKKFGKSDLTGPPFGTIVAQCHSKSRFMLLNCNSVRHCTLVTHQNLGTHQAEFEYSHHAEQK